MSSSRFTRVVEVLANLATFAAGIAVCYAVFRGTGMPVSARTVDAKGYLSGERFAETTEIDFKASSRTAVLFLNSHCKFCENSMPFYRRLAEDPGRKGGTFRLVAVSAEEVSVTSDYLKRNGLSVDQVVTARAGTGKIKSTPTIVIVNKGSVVQNAWRGQIPTDREQEVLKALLSN